MPSLSASRLNGFLGCRHQTALWLAGVKPTGKVDATLELVREKGFDHEAQTLARLEQRFGAAVHIPTGGPLEDRLRLTQEAVAGGATLIYQGALRNKDWIGYPDFLVRSDDGLASALQPEDAKLSRSAKGEHVLQLGIYAELLDETFGIPVERGVVHVGMGDPKSFDLRRTRFILKRLMRQFEHFVASDQRDTVPQPCAACARCDYKARCEEEWRSADSPFFVAGLSGAQVAKLASSGVSTLAELAELSSMSKVDGIGAETLAKLSAQARLQHAARINGRHSFELLPVQPGRGFTLLPLPDDGDLYFDMEGDPLVGEGLEYLFGLYGRLDGGSEQTFLPIWAHDTAAEKAAFERLMRLLLDHMRRHPDAHIYHYAPYETTALKRLAMRYATMEAELDQLLREHRFVDLYRVVVQGLRASTEGYSIKNLEALYWSGRGGAVQTASDSIVEYERWCLTREDAILDAIAAYNEDDCVSTAKLHAWLEGLRPSGANLARDESGSDAKPEQSAKRAEFEERRQAIASAVRGCTHGDARVRDLVAELLCFHQRSQKPGWWAVFERQTWLEEDLVEDPESLGDLTRDLRIVPAPVKRSLDTTFVFPPQDTKLKPGDKPKIAETIANAGIIISIAADEGRIVLRRGVTAPALPDRFSLIPAPIDMLSVPDAVMGFAERFAAGGSGGDRAVLDILMRSAPRFRGRNVGAPVRASGEPLTDAVIRAVTDLDHSYLFVQGPPGTGKTYVSSQAIVALLKAGKRVGVASNSHKAINNLLAEIDKRAAEQRFRYRGVKKGTADVSETEYVSDNMITVTTSEAVTMQHRLVGGTVFHFSREDQRGRYDHLFVDEAGQVSLGNIVAMGPAAANIVLVGDQMQLPQPVQGVHPGESGLSSLEYLLEQRATVPEDQGILLNESRRLHPDLCTFISEAVYDGRLGAHASTATRYLRIRDGENAALRTAGLSFIPVDHDGCTQSSRPEAEAIRDLVDRLRHQEVVRDGVATPLALDDILVVAPYNLQVNLLKQVLPPGTKVGTVDKFQGQEAAVVIVSMTTSRGVDAPRGTEFLFNPNRFNVAVSRAQCLAIVVHGTQLLEGSWTKIGDLERLNLFAHAEVEGNGKI